MRWTNPEKAEQAFQYLCAARRELGRNCPVLADRQIELAQKVLTSMNYEASVQVTSAMNPMTASTCVIDYVHAPTSMK